MKPAGALDDEPDMKALERIRNWSVLAAFTAALTAFSLTVVSAPPQSTVPIYLIVSVIQGISAYRMFSILKRRFKLPELSPAKASLSVCLPNTILLILVGMIAMINAMNAAMAPLAVIVPLAADVGILLIALTLYTLVQQAKWVHQIGHRFLAIESMAAGDPLIQVSRTLLFFNWFWVTLGFFLPSVAYFLIPAIYANAGKRNLPKWDSFDSATRHLLSVTKTKKKTLYKDPNRMILRYQTSSGVEQWMRERFAERSWKKGAFILAIAALFLFCGGPTLFVAAIPHLFAFGAAAGGASTGAASSAASIAATQSLVTLIVDFLFFPAVLLYFVQIWRTPTHLELANTGARFLWRYPLFRRVGPTVPWNAIEDVSIKRPFGKTLPQDASVCLTGRGGKELLNAKLRFIPSIDDKATLLEALDKWCNRSTARGADVIELLSPPADHSYTELWLQALTAPPKRERLKPLIPEAVLHDDTYQIICDIGAGGQGFAYLATDMKTHRKVVLKEYLLPIFVDMESRRRAISHFEMEARTLQSLQSEQIVKLLDFFIEDHRAYLVLEHIDGESLKQLVERIGPLKTHNVLQLASQMCDILRYLHGLTPPLVHRDFTPDNLILRPDGKLKLIDFNVAQKVDNESTFTGTIVGKQSYLPPEQFRGMACPASDIYALGCCLFYLLVGHEPEPITVSHPLKERDSVPPELDDITARATALEVEDRFTTIDDVAARINKMLEAGEDGSV